MYHTPKSYAEFVRAVDAEVYNRTGLGLDLLPESGPMPFDYPNFHVEWEVGTSPVDVAGQVLYCADPDLFPAVL